MPNKKPPKHLGTNTQPLGDQMLPIQRLHLDPLNPRHNPLESDAEVIAQLCGKEYVFALANDVVKRGSLSPLDVLGVIPFDGHPNHYIAVEGNRRACALILLSDPNRAPTAVLQDQFRRIASNANIPKQVKVHVFANRADAKQWIDLRHLGSQGGIGTIEWDPDQKTRAAEGNTRTSSHQNKLALAVLDRLVAKGLLSSEQRNKVSLTTVARYLGTPGVRTLLGLDSHTDLIYTHDASEVDAALQRLVLDSLSINGNQTPLVHSRSDRNARLDYARRLQSEGVTPQTTLPTPAFPPVSGALAT